MCVHAWHAVLMSCMCVCAYVCLHAFVYVREGTHIYKLVQILHVSMLVDICVLLFVLLYMCVHTCYVYVPIHIYVCDV